MTFPDAPWSCTLQAVEGEEYLTGLEGDMVQGMRWLSENCTLKDDVDPQDLLDIIEVSSDDDDSPPGRQESVGGSGGDATPQGSTWEESQVNSNPRDVALCADRAGCVQGQQDTVRGRSASFSGAR